MSGSLTIGSIFSEQVVVGIGDMAVSNRPGMKISTFALGSCIGVVVYDQANKVGGLIHIMLPTSDIAPAKAIENPARFADTGLPKFFNTLGSMGMNKHRAKIFVGGGANVLTTGSDLFKIGQRNITATKKFMSRNGLRADFESLGGFENRTVHLELMTGELTLRMPSKTQTISLA